MDATAYSHFRYGDASRRAHFIVKEVGSAGDYFYAHGYNSKSELVASDRYAGNDPDLPGPAGNPYFDYAYDEIGNRETSAVDGSTRVYTTNDLNQYTAVTTPSQSPIYDVDGNLTEDGAHEFAWDGENRLIQVADVAPVGDIETRVSYAYDYLGRMVRRHVERYDHSQQNPSWVTESVTLYVYDGWRMILELDALDEDAPLRSHYWGLDLSGTLDGAAGIGGLPATVAHDTPTTCFVLFDGHGNVTQLVDAGDGSEAAEFEYDPYGNRLDTRTDLPLPFGFSTKFIDPETGLYYYGFRWYQASWGRWVSRDPIGEIGFTLLLYNRASRSPFDWEEGTRYSFVNNRPPLDYDSVGLTPGPSPAPTPDPNLLPTPTKCPGVCGPDVTAQLKAVITKLKSTFNTVWTNSQRKAACRGIGVLPYVFGETDPAKQGQPAYLNAWDVDQLFANTGNPGALWMNKEPYCPPCNTPQSICQSTVAVSDGCYYSGSVNYVIFGHMNRLCDHFALAQRLLIYAYKSGAANYDVSQAWARAGYDDWPTGGSTPAPDRPGCGTTCSVAYQGSAFKFYWYPNGWN